MCMGSTGGEFSYYGRRPMTEACSTFRRHIIADIEPYICVLRNCTTPQRTFRTFDDWLGHMQLKHFSPKWECSAPMHQPEEFTSFELYIDHWKQVHKTAASDTQLGELARLSACAKTQIFETCPLCTCVPASLGAAFRDPKLSVTQNALHVHIAQHLKSLALISLSWLDDRKCSDDASDEASDGKEDEQDGDSNSMMLSAFNLPDRNLVELSDPELRSQYPTNDDKGYDPAWNAWQLHGDTNYTRDKEWNLVRPNSESESNSSDSLVYLLPPQYEGRLCDKTLKNFIERLEISLEYQQGRALMLLILSAALLTSDLDSLLLQIVKLSSIHQLQEGKTRLPPKLRDLYEKLLDSIPLGEKARLWQLMRWICFGSRPLTLEELRCALTLRASADDTLSEHIWNDISYTSDKELILRLKIHSVGLVQFKPSETSEIASFIHHSVAEYLFEGGFGMPDGISITTMVARANSQLSQACFEYLSSEELAQESGKEIYSTYFVDEDVRQTLEDNFPFLAYTTKSWLLHIERAEESQITQDYLLDLTHVLRTNTMRTWVWAYRTLNPFCRACPSKEASL